MSKIDQLVELTETRYKELLHAEKKLIALENAGVDNWEWYGDAMEAMENDDAVQD